MLRKENEIITDTKKIVQVLNDHYISIVERFCGGKTTSVAKQSYLTDDIQIVDHIIRHYEDQHIKKNVKIPQNSTCSDDIQIVDHIVRQYEDQHLKKNVKTPQNSTCSLLAISEQDAKKIIKELSTEKSTGVDMMSPKLVKLAVNYLAEPLS